MVADRNDGRTAEQLLARPGWLATSQGHEGRAIRECVWIRRPKERSKLIVDVWEVPRESFGTALLHCTGSLTFNVIVRRWARMRGMSLNLLDITDSRSRRTFESERAVLDHLSFPWIPPELRSEPACLEACREQLREMNAT